MKNGIKIGTRGSKLALLQTQMVADALRASHPGLDVEVVEILTSGDWRPEQGETRLSEAEGGKGLFAKEIERAILDGTVDCGVHSMKDMPSFLPDGLVIEHMLPRDDVRDALLANVDCRTLDDVPQGAVVGTSSLRRQAFILARRPDLRVEPLRGNVPTRIEKMKNGQVDVALLAYSGLRRLGLEGEAAFVLSPELMLPAAGQGAIGIEIRKGDSETAALMAPLHCENTGLCVSAERAALQILDGSCHTPIGALAQLDGQNMSLSVAVGAIDGRDIYEHMADGLVATTAQAVALGEQVGRILKDRVPPALLQ